MRILQKLTDICDLTLTPTTLRPIGTSLVWNLCEGDPDRLFGVQEGRHNGTLDLEEKIISNRIKNKRPNTTRLRESILYFTSHLVVTALSDFIYSSFGLTKGL